MGHLKTVKRIDLILSILFSPTPLKKKGGHEESFGGMALFITLTVVMVSHFVFTCSKLSNYVH